MGLGLVNRSNDIQARDGGGSSADTALKEEEEKERPVLLTVQPLTSITEEVSQPLIKLNGSLILTPEGALNRRGTLNAQRRMTLDGQQQELFTASETIAPWRARWIPCLINPVYQGVLASFNLFFSIFMLAVDNMLVWKATNFEIIAAFCMVVNCIYLVDMIMNFVVLGFK